MSTATNISDSGNSIAAMTNNSASAAHVRQVIKHLIPAIDSDEDSSQSECGSNGPSNTHGTFTSNSYDKKDVPLSANEMQETSHTPYLIANDTTHYHGNVNTNKINVNNNNIEKLYAVNEINASAPLPLAEITTAAPVQSTQSVLTTATDKDELHSLHSFLTSTSKSRLPRRTAQKCFSSSHSEHDELESNMLLSAHENESNTTNHLIAHSITTQVDDHNNYRDVEQMPNNRWLKREELRKLYAIDDSSSICSSNSSKSSSSYTSHEEDVNEVSDIKNNEIEPTDNKTVVAPTNAGTSPSSPLAEEINSTKTGFQQNQEEEYKKHEDDEVNKLMEEHDYDVDNDDVDTSFENVFKTKRTNNNNFTGLEEEGKHTHEVNDGYNERNIVSAEKKENISAKNESITNNKIHHSSNAAGTLQPLPYVEDEIDEWQLTKTIEDSQGEVTNLESGRSPSEASQAEFLPESPLELEGELEKEQKEYEDKKCTITSNKALNEENVHVHVNEERLQEKYEPSPLSDYAYDHDLQSAISFPSYAEKSMTSMNAEHLSLVEKEANNDVKRKEITEHSLAHASSSEKELNSQCKEEHEQKHEHEQDNNLLASETHKVYVDKKVIESVPTWVHRLSSTTNKHSTTNNSISSQRSNSYEINKSKNVSLSRTPRSRSSSNASISNRSNGDYNVMHTSQSRLSQKSASVTSNAESKRSKYSDNINYNNTQTKMESREVKSNTSSRSRSQSIPDWVNRLSTPLARRSVSASASRSSSVASFTQTSTKRFNPRLTPHQIEHDEEGQESTVMQSARSLSSASHPMSEMHQYHSMKSNRQHSRSLSSEVNTWRSAQSRPSTILTESRVHNFKENTTITPTPKSDMKLNSIAKKSESRSVSLVNKEHTLPRQPNTQSTHSSARSTSTPIRSSRSTLSASEERKSLLSQRNSGNLSSAQVSRRTSLSHHSSSQSKKSNSLVNITESKQNSLTNYVKELQQRQQMQSGEEYEEYYENANEWKSPSDPSHHSASSRASSQTRKSNVHVAQGKANHSNDSKHNNSNGKNNNNINASKSKNARSNGDLTSSTLSSANQTSRIATRKNTHQSNESIMHTLRLDLRRREDRKELHKQQYCVDPQLQMRPCKRQFHITPQLDLFGVYERHNMTVNSARSEQPLANNNWTSPQNKTTVTTASVVGKSKPEEQSKRKPFVVNNSSNSARVRAITRSQSADNMKSNNGEQKKYTNDISMLTRFVGGYDDDNENGKVKTSSKIHTYRSVSGKRVSRVNGEQYNAHKDQLNLFS